MKSLLKNKKGQVGMFDNLYVMVIFLVVVSIGGILAGIIYYDLSLIDTTIHSVDFTLPIENPGHGNTNGVVNVTNFQDIMGLTIYPLLGLRNALPYLTYFMVFAFIIALAMMAYMSSKNPIFFVVHILVTFGITYFAIILSNSYITLMANPFINAMMIPFTIYNKLMFYLPQVIFFTSLLFGAIAFINLIKPQTAAQATGLQYGGDY